MKTSWRDEGARLLRLANEIAADRPKQPWEKWQPGEPDYSHIDMNIIYSPAFRSLDGKPSYVYGYFSANEFACDVAECAGRIALDCDADTPYGFCSALAYAHFSGFSPEGMNGNEALKLLCGGDYSVSGISLRILARIARQPIPEDFIECLTELDYGDIQQINNTGARIVWFSRRLLENISLMTDEEKEAWGGMLAAIVMCDHIELNDDGQVDGSAYFWEADRLVLPRRKSPDHAEVGSLAAKYEALLKVSADDWDFIGKLLDFTPHHEWEAADRVYMHGEKELTVRAVSRIGEAAVMGYPAAQYELGKLYAAGAHGMRKDTARARYWLSAAAEGGNTDAAALLHRS